MTKKQHYMTEPERHKLEAYLEAGKGVSWIARQLGFCRQTIYNEMKRGSYLHNCGWYDEERYSADKGQQIHNYNQTAKGPELKIERDRTYADFLERKLGKQRFRERFKSITTDNGSEFLEDEELTKSVFGGKRFEVYYCHSYSAWEKGTNENHNRLMRRFFPKGTDFTKVSQREIQEAVDFLNNYPREILGWNTPAEAA